MVDLYDGYNYPQYGLVLFLWEILPTIIVTVFFRVQAPTQVPVVRSLNQTLQATNPLPGPIVVVTFSMGHTIQETPCPIVAVT